MYLIFIEYTGRSTLLGGRALDLGVRLFPQRRSDKVYVLVQINTELLGAADDVFAVYGGGEGLLLHLFVDALRFQALQTLWSY
jgi:hypothetical protein